MAGTTHIAMATIGSADVSKLKDPELMVSLLATAVKATNIKSMGKVHFQLYPPKTVNGKMVAPMICPLLAMQCLKTGSAMLATSPSEGLIEISIGSHEPFTMDNFEKALAPYSEWAWLVDFTWLRKHDGAWVSDTVLDTKNT